MTFLGKSAKHTLTSECCNLVGDTLEIEGKWGDGSLGLVEWMWLGLVEWMWLFINSIYLVVRLYTRVGVTVYI